MNSVFILSLLALYFPAFASGHKKSLEEVLRLKAGNFWVYRGNVEWTTVATAEHESTFGKKSITWRSEIKEESDHGPVKAYLVHGSVADLPWYEPGRQPGDYLWMVYEGRFYELTLQPGFMARFHDSNDGLMDLIDAEEPMIELPLRLGVCNTALHPAEKRERNDMLYCWHFEEKQQITAHIKGLGVGPVEEWRLWYRSLPDHQIWSLAAGVGFTAYDFGHHGTLSEAHVKLVEAHLQ